MKSSSWFHNLHRRAHAFTSGSDVTTLLGVHRCFTFGSDVTARHIASPIAENDADEKFLLFCLGRSLSFVVSWSGTHSIICLPPSRLAYLFLLAKAQKKNLGVPSLHVSYAHWPLSSFWPTHICTVRMYALHPFAISASRVGISYTLSLALTREDAWEKGSSQALSVRQLDPRTLPVDLSARIGRELLLT